MLCDVRGVMGDVRCAIGDVRLAMCDWRCAIGDVRLAMCDVATCNMRRAITAVRSRSD
jgi:hypothetical protein